MRRLINSPIGSSDTALSLKRAWASSMDSRFLERALDSEGIAKGARSRDSAPRSRAVRIDGAFQNEDSKALGSHWSRTPMHTQIGCVSRCQSALDRLEASSKRRDSRGHSRETGSITTFSDTPGRPHTKWRQMKSLGKNIPKFFSQIGIWIQMAIGSILVLDFYRVTQYCVILN